ncbi:MAG: DUF924 domain-containing protein [Pseudomonadaceae bacterium]|nr:DUF924 domain-containing protein [Pseudomonadaceae bacterium]
MSADFEQLLDFWFGPLNNGLAADKQRKLWFNPDKNFDARCRDEYLPFLQRAQNGMLDAWLDTPRGQLAFILLTDQLPRNIFRGTRDAFAYDALALATARNGVVTGSDRQLALDEQSFFYMPFEHSEDISDQHMAVGLFTYLRDSSPKNAREITGTALRFAQQHRDIILKFGRFPHRNAVLGRESTAEEVELIEAGDGFGQLAPKS